MPTYLTPEQLARDLALRDLTDADAGPHAIQSLVGLAADALVAAWRCPARSSPGPRIVPIADNYDNLGFTADAASRDARYARYVDGRRMLRSHSSAMVPAALRSLAVEPADDVLLVCPGIVYRRDAIDRLHTGTPHQLDLWRISRRPLTNADMDQMVALLADTLAPGRPWRTEPRVHPYTVDGCCVPPTPASRARCSTSSPTAPSRPCRPWRATYRSPSTPTTTSNSWATASETP